MKLNFQGGEGNEETIKDAFKSIDVGLSSLNNHGRVRIFSSRRLAGLDPVVIGICSFSLVWGVRQVGVIT